MKHGFTALVTAVLLGSAVGTLARLSETEKECEQRYGKPIEGGESAGYDLVDGAEHREYRFDDWQVRVAFVEGKACCLEYSKIRKADGSGTVVIQPEEIEAMLAAEAGGGTWQEQKPESSSNPFTALGRFVQNEVTWTNANGSHAVLRQNKLILRFESPAAAQFERAQKRQSAPRF